MTRELCRQAGVVVAESLADFEDYTRLFCLLRGRRIAGWRLGALSNAGFECVAISDSAHRLDLVPFSEPTRRRLQGLLRRHRLHGIVEVRNPVDLTPMLDDEGYEEAIRAVLGDPDIDLGAVGIVPLTGALDTLPARAGQREEVLRAGSIAQRMRLLAQEVDKPWVCIVDGGALYDPMARQIEAAGIPTFRSADRALRALEAFAAARLRVTCR